MRTPAVAAGMREAQAAFAALDADVAVVAAYGLILPQPVLDAPRLGCLNVHGSLLPRWRGAAPIQRAILAGDAETGVGIMQMEAGLDTGPVRLEGRTPIDGKTAGELTAELAAMGARLMVEVLADLDALSARCRSRRRASPMPPRSTRPRRGWISRERASEVERQVRAFNPAPGALVRDRGRAGAGARGRRAARRRCTACAGHDVLDDRLTIACGDGAIRPTLVQRAGRGVMTAEELLRGFPIPAGHAALTRFALTVEYDGRPFMGWQRQDHGPSVQQAIEEAAFAVTGETVRGPCRGAHRCRASMRWRCARMSISRRPITPFRLMEALNAQLRPRSGRDPGVRGRGGRLACALLVHRAAL